MYNVKGLAKLANGDGATYDRHGKSIRYKSGYQVATHGVATFDAKEASEYLRRGFNGLWKENDVYYVDISFRVSTKREAMEIGRKYNQLTILRWKDMAVLPVE